MMRRALLPTLCAALPACGFLADGAPVPAALRLGGREDGTAENSLDALDLALQDGWSAVHADLQLSADGTPHLYAHPAPDPDRCALADGSPPGDAPISDRTDAGIAELRCDGTPIPTLPDLLAAAAAAPDLRLHLSATGLSDTGRADGAGSDPDADAAYTALAVAAIAALDAASPPNPITLSSDRTAFLDAARDGARARCLWWPGTSEDPSPPGKIAAIEALQTLGLADPLRAAEEAGANCLVLPPALLDLGLAEAAAARDISLILAAPTGDNRLALYCGWPIHSLLTAAPRPCRS